MAQSSYCVNVYNGDCCSNLDVVPEGILTLYDFIMHCTIFLVIDIISRTTMLFVISLTFHGDNPYFLLQTEGDEL